MLDREGAKRAVVLGCAIAAVGFGLWASKATTLSFGKQQIWVIVAGAGMGMMLGPANTDAVNRAGNLSYGEATGITQTIRNFGASLGLAALGTILLFDLPLAPDDDAELPEALGDAARRRRGQPDHAEPAGQRFGDVHPALRLARLRPRHRRRCSTSCAGSWPSPASSRSSACNGAARRWCRSRTTVPPSVPTARRPGAAT